MFLFALDVLTSQTKMICSRTTSTFSFVQHFSFFRITESANISLSVKVSVEYIILTRCFSLAQ